MTSLIDVIFLLLLFFMLSSTFTRFAEIELAAGAGAGGTGVERPVFLSLSPDALRLNGESADLTGLPAALNQRRGSAGAPLPVLVALHGPVTAQRLTDLLAALRALPGLRITVLEAA